MSAVGLINYFNIKLPHWFSFVIYWGVFEILFYIFTIETFFIGNNRLFVFVSILTSIMLTIKLWFGIQVEKVIKKIVFISISAIYLYITTHLTILGIQKINVWVFPQDNIASICIDVVSSGDNKPHRKYDGKFLVVEYNGILNEITVPEVVAKKMSKIPACLDVEIVEGKLGGAYINKIYW